MAKYHSAAETEVDASVRIAAFQFIADQIGTTAEQTISHAILLKGFTIRGQRVPLLGPQGIFKPAILSLPLSFYTAPAKPGQPPLPPV